MIINGYAFIQDGGNIKVLNLNNTEMAMGLNKAGEVLETTMCDIEIQIAVQTARQEAREGRLYFAAKQKKEAKNNK